jgi:hypothetical protein
VTSPVKTGRATDQPERPIGEDPEFSDNDWSRGMGWNWPDAVRPTRGTRSG